MSRTNFDQLLEAGCHFGHLRRKWNPAMAPYIFMERNGIHIIDLHKTVAKIDDAAEALKQVAKSGKKMSELNGIYAQYPQVLVNVTANAAQKQAYKEDEVLAGFIENEQQKLMGMGRVLVRVSGTEPKIRVMVEGQDLEAIHRCADRIVEKINKRILKQ